MEKDLSTWKVGELKDKLRNLGLKVSGNKADLIKRIEQHSFLTGVVDLDRKILLNLSSKDLARACQGNKYSIKLCSDEKFLQLRLERNYKGNANKALAEAAEYGDILFVKYLVGTRDASFNSVFGRKYAAFWNAYYNENYGIIKYLIDNTRIYKDDLYKLLYKAVIDDEYDSAYIAKYIIEKSGIVSKLINEGKNIGKTYKKLINHKLAKNSQALQYLIMMNYLYENIEKSIYLKVLVNLSKSEGDYALPSHLA